MSVEYFTCCSLVAKFDEQRAIDSEQLAAAEAAYTKAQENYNAALTTFKDEWNKIRAMGRVSDEFIDFISNWRNISVTLSEGRDTSLQTAVTEVESALSKILAKSPIGDEKLEKVNDLLMSFGLNKGATNN